MQNVLTNYIPLFHLCFHLTQKFKTRHVMFARLDQHSRSISKKKKTHSDSFFFPKSRCLVGQIIERMLSWALESIKHITIICTYIHKKTSSVTSYLEWLLCWENNSMIKFYHSLVVTWNKDINWLIIIWKQEQNVSEKVWQQQFQQVLVKSVCVCWFGAGDYVRANRRPWFMGPRN